MRKLAILVLFTITLGVGVAGVGYISAANAYPPDPCDEAIDGF